MRCNGRSSIAAQLALAALHFNQRNYQEALKLCVAAVFLLELLCCCQQRFGFFCAGFCIYMTASDAVFAPAHAYHGCS